MQRKPEVDWWSAPKLAEAAPEPHTKEELKTIEQEMQEHLDVTDAMIKIRKHETTPFHQQQYVPADPSPHLLNDLDAATAITVTMQPAVFLQFQHHMRLLQMSEEILLSMRGGDLWLMKDRRGRAPALIDQGNKSWYEHKVKGKQR